MDILCSATFAHAWFDATSLEQVDAFLAGSADPALSDLCSLSSLDLLPAVIVAMADGTVPGVTLDELLAHNPEPASVLGELLDARTRAGQRLSDREFDYVLSEPVYLPLVNNLEGRSTPMYALLTKRQRCHLAHSDRDQLRTILDPESELAELSPTPDCDERLTRLVNRVRLLDPLPQFRTTLSSVVTARIRTADTHESCQHLADLAAAAMVEGCLDTPLDVVRAAEVFWTGEHGHSSPTRYCGALSQTFLSILAPSGAVPEDPQWPPLGPGDLTELHTAVLRAATRHPSILDAWRGALRGLDATKPGVLDPTDAHFDELMDLCWTYECEPLVRHRAVYSEWYLTRVREALGTDPRVWETFTSLLADWGLSLAELFDTTRELAKHHDESPRGLPPEPAPYGNSTDQEE